MCTFYGEFYWRCVEAVCDFTCYFTVAYPTLHSGLKKILSYSRCSCFHLIFSFVNKMLPKYLKGKNNQTTDWTSDESWYNSRQEQEHFFVHVIRTSSEVYRGSFFLNRNGGPFSIRKPSGLLTYYQVQDWVDACPHSPYTPSGPVQDQLCLLPKFEFTFLSIG